jgi:hypothetical protein
MDAAQDSMLLLCRVLQSGGTLAPTSLLRRQVLESGWSLAAFRGPLKPGRRVVFRGARIVTTGYTGVVTVVPVSQQHDALYMLSCVCIHYIAASTRCTTGARLQIGIIGSRASSHD